MHPTLAQKRTNQRFQVENTQHLGALYLFFIRVEATINIAGSVRVERRCLLSTALPYPPTGRKTLGVLCLPSSSESERLQWNDRACWEESDKDLLNKVCQECVY